MFLEMYDIEPFKAFFDLIFDSTDIIEFKLNEYGLNMSLLNNSHICFYEANFDKDFFNEYEVTGAESVLVHIDDLYKVLKNTGKNDVLSLETTESYLVCKFEHEGNRRVFELPLAMDYGDSPVPPTVDYDTSFQVKLSELKQPCMDLDKIVKTDRFKMVTKSNTLSVVAPSDSQTKYVNTIDVSDECKDHSCAVNLNYILQILKLNKINTIVEFKIGDNMPLTWSLSSVDDTVLIKGLIAPIIEEEA